MVDELAYVISILIFKEMMRVSFLPLPLHATGHSIIKLAGVLSEHIIRREGKHGIRR